MTGIPEGAVHRLLTGLTSETTRLVRRGERQRANMEPTEVEQQFQVPFSGVALPEPVFVNVTVPFRYHFYFDNRRRDSTLNFPHFSFGSQMEPPLPVHATIVEWTVNGNGGVMGAVVAVAVTGEGEFSGFVHLTFQGLGIVADSAETEDEETEAEEGEVGNSE